MEALEIDEPELADEIRRKMFVFEDIITLDDRSIQRVLRDVENNDLAITIHLSNTLCYICLLFRIQRSNNLC